MYSEWNENFLYLSKTAVKISVPDKRINLLCSRMELRCSVLNVRRWWSLLEVSSSAENAGIFVRLMPPTRWRAVRCARKMRSRLWTMKRIKSKPCPPFRSNARNASTILPSGGSASCGLQMKARCGSSGARNADTPGDNMTDLQSYLYN